MAIIGGGFGGMLAGAGFQELGVTDFEIIESGGILVVPGTGIDIRERSALESCLSALLEELGYMPKEKYSYALKSMNTPSASKDLICDKACFQTKVEDIVWQEETGTWLITTDREDAMQARFVVMTVALLMTQITGGGRCRNIQRPYLSYLALGLSLYRW